MPPSMPPFRRTGGGPRTRTRGPTPGSGEQHDRSHHGCDTRSHCAVDCRSVAHLLRCADTSRPCTAWTVRVLGADPKTIVRGTALPANRTRVDQRRRVRTCGRWSRVTRGQRTWAGVSIGKSPIETSTPPLGTLGRPSCPAASLGIEKLVARIQAAARPRWCRTRRIRPNRAEPRASGQGRRLYSPARRVSCPPRALDPARASAGCRARRESRPHTCAGQPSRSGRRGWRRRCHHWCSARRTRRVCASRGWSCGRWM